MNKRLAVPRAVSLLRCCVARVDLTKNRRRFPFHIHNTTHSHGINISPIFKCILFFSMARPETFFSTFPIHDEDIFKKEEEDHIDNRSLDDMLGPANGILLYKREILEEDLPFQLSSVD